MSVLQLVKTFEKVTGAAVPYKIVERRKGDISMMYANADLVEKELGWKAEHSLEEMCKYCLTSLRLVISNAYVENVLLQVLIFGDGKL